MPLPVSGDELAGSVATELSKENLSPNQALEEFRKIFVGSNAAGSSAEIGR